MARLPPALRQHTISVPPDGVEPTPARRVITEHLQPMFAKLRPWVFAIDPGEEHAGMAWTRDLPTLIGGETVGSRFTAATDNPDGCTDRFARWCSEARIAGVTRAKVVVENYRLDPAKLQMHMGSDVPTLQHIGALKYVARVHKIEVIMQNRDIKKPMAGILNGRGLKALGDSRHAKDAELHLWYYCLQGTLPGLR
jgi:hypothetical protein